MNKQKFKHMTYTHSEDSHQYVLSTQSDQSLSYPNEES